MMDLWATVPYYTAYLSRALIIAGANVVVGSISYYLDPTCFSGRGLRLNPGLLDVVGRLQLPRIPRRIFKLLEALINMSALTVRFLISPPEIIHVQYLPMLRWRIPLDSWFLWICRKRGSKIVLTIHDLLPHDTAEAHKRTFQSLYIRMDAIICHSDHIKTRLEAEFGVPEQRISVIAHGPFFYDLPEGDPKRILRELDVPPEQLLVLWQGIIFPYKGLDLLLNAWQEVELQVPEAFLVVAGTGASDLLDQLREQVRQLGLTRVKLHLRFISAEDLVAAYRAADIVVYPYRAITTSGALATGLALGKTIIASNLPVFRELLEDRVNAILINPHRSGELAGALVELAQTPALRQQLAENVASMHFGNQSWLSIATKTLRAYDDILSRARML